MILKKPMISKKLKFLMTLMLVFVLFGYNLKAQETKKWTMEECIDYALMNNLSVMRSQLSVKDYELLLKQSKAALLPSLNLGGGYSNRWGRSIDPTTNRFSTERIQSLNAYGQSQMMVYGGSRLRNSIKQNQTNLEGSHYDLEKAQNDLMLGVATDFLSIILNTELLENAQLQLQTTQSQLETTSKQVKAGALPMSSELDLVAQVESNKVQVINSENDVRLSKLRLKQLLMIPSGEAFEIVIPEFGLEDLDGVLLSPEDIYSESEGIMPEIHGAEKLVESAELGVKIARGGFDPRLSISADIYSNYSSVADNRRYVVDPNQPPTTIEVPIGYVYNPLDLNQRFPVFNEQEIPGGEFEDGYAIPSQIADNVSRSVGLNLTIPIFNGLQTKTGYQRAKIQSEQARLYAEETRQILRQNIELAYNNALAASETFNASTKQVASLEESFRAAEKSYNLGAMNIYDYQVASNNLFRARSDLLRAKYNYIFTEKVLDFYLGKPLSID